MKQTLKYTLSLFAFFLLREVLFSQNQIIGKVVNDKAEAVAFANVLLFKAIDSSFVKGQVAQDELKTQNLSPKLKTGPLSINAKSRYFFVK